MPDAAETGRKNVFVTKEKQTEKAGRKCNGKREFAISWLSRGREISASVS